MIYRNMNDVRIRANKIANILNQATNFSRQPLPDEFNDLDREWHDLVSIKPIDVKNNSVEVKEASYSPKEVSA